MRIFSILLAGVMPVSCDAAAPPKATVKSPVKAVAKSAAPVVRAAPQAIGVFRLDRAPQQGSIARGTVPPGTIRLVMNGQDVDFAPDGKFVIGFGRDFDATAIIVAYLGNGQSMSERQTVAKRPGRSKASPPFVAIRSPMPNFRRAGRVNWRRSTLRDAPMSSLMAGGSS